MSDVLETLSTAPEGGAPCAFRLLNDEAAAVAAATAGSLTVLGSLVVPIGGTGLDGPGMLFLIMGCDLEVSVS